MSEEQFYCSDRIKELVDLTQFDRALETHADDASQIFGDFVSYSRSKNRITLQVDKRIIKDLFLKVEKNFFYSYSDVKFFLSSENLDVSKIEEKFLVSLDVSRVEGD